MKKAFFYGDSNTFGYDPADYLTGRYPWKHRWTGILKDRFTGEWEIKVDGMPGRVIPKPGKETDTALQGTRGAQRIPVCGRVFLGSGFCLRRSAPV